MRPSDRYDAALRVLGLNLQPIAAAAKAASDLDRAALEYAESALRVAVQWRKDTTETARRNAAANAAACQALAVAPVAGRGSNERQALAAYAAAILRLVEGDIVGATRTADAARNRLYV